MLRKSFTEMYLFIRIFFIELRGLQVDHPHVVRLLGACTDPAGPLLLLLELAELGSLRSFLRRSRGLGLEPAVAPPAVSDRELIGFATQVARGLQHLAEIKVGRNEQIFITPTSTFPCSWCTETWPPGTSS